MQVDMNLGDTQLILKECARQGLSKAHTAYVLATARWETAHTMKPVREAFWLSEAWRKRNLRYWPWYGRGYVQLTWEDNYIFAGKQLKLDLTTNPDVVMQPDVSAKILVTGMVEGWFRKGKKLSTFTTYEGMRDIINGDMAKVSKDTGKRIDVSIADLARAYEKALPDAIVEKGVTSNGLFELIQRIIGKLFGVK